MHLLYTPMRVFLVSEALATTSHLVAEAWDETFNNYARFSQHDIWIPDFCAQEERFCQ